MPRTRRNLLVDGIRLGITAVTMTAGLLAGHGLMRRRGRSYPPRPATYGPHGKRLIRPPGAVSASRTRMR